MITFETKVWENDWEIILKTNYLDQLISFCNYPFKTKNLIINNVVNRKKVEKYCKKKVDAGVIDAFFLLKIRL